MKSNEILQVIQEFKGESKLKRIENPNKEIRITSLTKKVIGIMGLTNREVTITRKALKHIVNSREINKEDVEYIIFSIPDVLKNPTKIVDNSKKRPNSFLFAKMNGEAKGVILEILQKERKNQIISAHFIRKGYYLKMKDILGRAAVPPSAVSK